MSIKVENLCHVYRKGLPEESKALDEVSFDVSDNQILGVIGHTGSGKSTLLQHLNGLLKADSGEISIDGMRLYAPEVSMLDIRKKVGLVFQYPEYQLFEETVAKDIAFGPKNLGLTEEEIDSRVREAMSLVNLDYDTFSEKSPFDLSGGQKRRVAIAGVLAMKPKILILDEPTAGLDPKTHKDILNMVVDIHRKEKNITVFVSHNMNDIANISDNIIVMDKGKCVLQGKPEEVFSHSDFIKSIGLDLPDVTQLMKDLGIEREDGKAIFSLDEAENMIFNMIGGSK